VCVCYHRMRRHVVSTQTPGEEVAKDSMNTQQGGGGMLARGHLHTSMDEVLSSPDVGSSKNSTVGSATISCEDRTYS
jgi:hypothetical protein